MVDEVQRYVLSIIYAEADAVEDLPMVESVDTNSLIDRVNHKGYMLFGQILQEEPCERGICWVPAEEHFQYNAERIASLDQAGPKHRHRYYVALAKPIIEKNYEA